MIEIVLFRQIYQNHAKKKRRVVFTDMSDKRVKRKNDKKTNFQFILEIKKQYQKRVSRKKAFQRKK